MRSVIIAYLSHLHIPLFRASCNGAEQYSGSPSNMYFIKP